MISRITNAAAIPVLDMISFDKKLMVPETSIVTRKMVSAHFPAFLCSRLALSDSVFATGILLIFCNKSGGRRDKSYGLGRVGFPREEPAVAEQAVSI